jgi:threonine dehydratase
MLPTCEDVRAAAGRIKDIVERTPLLRSDGLDAATGARVFVKAECLQRGGAFKLRGAANKIAQLSRAELTRGVFAYSSGNHGIGVAIAAGVFNTSAVILMPADAPKIKLDAVRAAGAEVVTYDRNSQSREQLGADLAAQSGRVLVKPFDDKDVIAGQGTVGLEIGEELAPDIVLVPASGAGLACGIALALPDAQVFAVEPDGHDDIARSLKSGAIAANEPGVRSVCDALMVQRMGDITFALAREKLAGAVSVDDGAVFGAMRIAHEQLNLKLEPSGAIALAALLEGKADAAGKCVVVVASGGNVDAEMFARALAAAL